jgi:hypothetical protein
VHPELFELKALVAGRLDTHRRREIDDHLGSCAECSRHYVALMLGSSSPKTAEAEAREALVPTGAGSLLTLMGGGSAPAPMYGIDAPIAPSATPRPPHNNLVALETKFPAASARTQVPVSASLVDAITRLRAESEGPRAAAAPAPVLELVRTPEPVAPPKPPTPAPEAVKAQEVSAPVAEVPRIAPSIFTPTPDGGVSLIDLPASPAPAPARTPPAPELTVTFSSMPRRTAAERSAAGGATIAAAAPAITPPSQQYVSQAVPTMVSRPASDVELSAPAAPKATSAMAPRIAMLGAAAVIGIVVSIAGYRYFHSSVSTAASAAAAAAAKQVHAAAAVRTLAATPALAEPPQVETRIVYVERPASRNAPPVQAKPETVLVAPSLPIAVTLPEVHLNTGADTSVHSSTHRSATHELTRTARATASRTGAPRP